MTETASFRSRFQEFAALYRWSFRKNVGLMFLLTLLLFMALPMLLLISAPGWRENYKDAVNLTAAQITDAINRQYTNFISTINALVFPVLMVFAVVLTVVLFGYFQKKRSVDFFHALPVGRVPLMLSGWCTGLTVLFIPYILNMLAVQIIASAYGFQANGTLSPVQLMFWVLLMTAAVFTFCMLMMACSGSVFDTAVSVLGISVGYPLLVLCGTTAAQMLLPGFAVEIRNHLGIVTALSPFAAAFVAVFADQSAGMLAWWLVLTVLMLFGACFVYRTRKSEAAEDRFAFPAVKIVIRFLATAVAGIGLGLILMSGNGGSGNFFIGLLAGSVAAHVTVEAVYSRGFRQLKRSSIWYAGFAVLFLIYYGVLCTGFFGYDQRVPNTADVQSVQVELNSDYGPGCNQIYDEDNRLLTTLKPVITKPEDIETVTQAHKKVAALIRSSGYPYLLTQFSDNHMNLVYTLKNGKTMTRSFQCFNQNMDLDAFSASTKDVSLMEEYYKGLDMIFYLQPEDIETIRFNDFRAGDKGDESEISSTKAKEVMEALREDFKKGKVNRPENMKVVKATKYEHAVTSDAPILNIDLSYKRDITPKDSRLIALLGSYHGKINMNSSGGYQIYSKDTETYRLFQKLGLVK
jgi:ABC-2 type transport system permease protein